jgi:hypothetical protein
VLLPAATLLAPVAPTVRALPVLLSVPMLLLG